MTKGLKSLFWAGEGGVEFLNSALILNTYCQIFLLVRIFKLIFVQK